MGGLSGGFQRWVSIVNLTGAQVPSDFDTAEFILVVEDEDEVRKVVCLTLELQGYYVLAAATPEQALDLVQSLDHPIDLLLTDVVMPGLSGPELFARIRVHMPDMRVLYISGYSEDALLAHGVAPREIAFLPKPFSSAALGRKVRQILHANKP